MHPLRCACIYICTGCTMNCDISLTLKVWIHGRLRAGAYRWLLSYHLRQHGGVCKGKIILFLARRHLKNLNKEKNDKLCNLTFCSKVSMVFANRPAPDWCRQPLVLKMDCVHKQSTCFKAAILANINA